MVRSIILSTLFYFAFFFAHGQGQVFYELDAQNHFIINGIQYLISHNDKNCNCSIQGTYIAKGSDFITAHLVDEMENKLALIFLI
jgi:hypothetical protein